MNKRRDKSDRIPEAELQIMQIIWEMHRTGVEDISAGAMTERYPHILGHKSPTTVLTLITRLHGRGFLSITKKGRSNCYTPLVSEEEYMKRITDHFISTVYKSNAKNLVLSLFSEGKLDTSDIAELREWINAHQNKG